jgi:outer membrane protein TolC
MAFRFMAQRVVPTTLPLLVYTTTGLLTLTLLAASPVRGDLPDPHPAIPAELTLSWCLERARAANPALESAHASAAAASSRVSFAGALDDPRIVYEASNIPTGDLDFRSTPLSGHQLGLKQKLPFPGLLSSREIAAERSAEASALSVDDQALITDGNVEAAWAELRFAQRALGITDRNVALLRQLAATAETRYRVGNGLQQDVLRAQVELTALLQERLRREEAALRAESHLVELLDLPATTKLPRTGDAPSVHEEPVLEPILASLDQRNAGLNAARKSVEAAEARLRSVELEGLPDVDLAIGYRVRRDVSGDPVNGDDFLSAGITVRLPVNRSKWRARSAEQRALLRRAEADLRTAYASLVSRTRRAHAALMRASAEAELLETGLIPQARQSLESSRSAYEVGRIEFLSLLDSQVRLLTAELRLARARADRRQAFASLEVAAGEKLR